MARRIIQLLDSPDDAPGVLYALCDDGTVWRRHWADLEGTGAWSRVWLQAINEDGAGGLDEFKPRSGRRIGDVNAKRRAQREKEAAPSPNGWSG